MAGPKKPNDFRVLIAYPNLPLMLMPSIAVALFTRIFRDKGYQVDIFETTYYVSQQESTSEARINLLQARKFNITEEIGITSSAVRPAGADIKSGCLICTRTPSDDYGTKFAATLARGVGNLGFCWLELIRQPYRGFQEGGAGMLTGLAKGVGHTLMRAVRGFGDITLSPLPKAKDGSQLAKSCPLCMMESP